MNPIISLEAPPTYFSDGRILTHFSHKLPTVDFDRVRTYARCTFGRSTTMKKIDETRRRFMAHFAGIGLGSTLLPGVLWGQFQQSGSQRVSAEMLKSALAVSAIDFSEEDRKAMLQGINQSLTRYEE